MQDSTVSRLILNARDSLDSALSCAKHSGNEELLNDDAGNFCDSPQRELETSGASPNLLSTSNNDFGKSSDHEEASNESVDMLTFTANNNVQKLEIRGNCAPTLEPEEPAASSGVSTKTVETDLVNDLNESIKSQFADINFDDDGFSTEEDIKGGELREKVQTERNSDNFSTDEDLESGVTGDLEGKGQTGEANPYADLIVRRLTLLYVCNIYHSELSLISGIQQCQGTHLKKKAFIAIFFLIQGVAVLSDFAEFFIVFCLFLLVFGFFVVVFFFFFLQGLMVGGWLFYF
jgi:hypothetical protein